MLIRNYWLSKLIFFAHPSLLQGVELALLVQEEFLEKGEDSLPQIYLERFLEFP